jgi:tRNA U34 5-carboxymethylaminomethyl modifying GTPase MnmE/TrmE
VLELDGISCVLFDCAGLLPETRRRDPVSRLAHQAAVDALRRAAVVLFCVDAEKESFEAELQILSQVQAETIIPVVTKADLADADKIERLLAQMKPLFAIPFSVTSACTGQGLAGLKNRIENTLVSGRTGAAQMDRLTLNQRHHTRLEEAVKTLGQAADEMMSGRQEVTAMLLRQSYETLGGLEQENISQKILDSIFSHFCIGK